MKENLDQASWLAQRDILRTLVKRIEIGKTPITIVFRVGPRPGVVTPFGVNLSRIVKGGCPSPGA